MNNYSFPFLIRNLPKKEKENAKNDFYRFKTKRLDNELDFDKSIFKTHFNSPVFNLKIKKTHSGERIWIDKIREFYRFNELYRDSDVIEWLKPIRCER